MSHAGDHSGEPESRVTFTFDGRAISAREGQSIGAALHAAGVRMFNRSFKYHRPRGLFCLAGDCPNCLMQVDGKPNVRTCIEPARSGQVVVPQNAWPSLNLDMLHLFDRLDRFLPVGFYYKKFHKPGWLWPILEPVIRQVAGLGRIDIHDLPPAPGVGEHRHADVCVIGGGPAGLAAAETADRAGARVLLLDRQPRPGGHWLYRGDHEQRLKDMLALLASRPRVKILSGASVFGIYEGNLVGAFQGDCLLKIRARQVLVCTGSRQRPFLFHNNDVPGIFLGDGALRLARMHGVLPGRRAVVLTDHDGGHELARELEILGMEVAAVVDVRPQVPQTRAGSWIIYSSSALVEAIGRKYLRAVRVGKCVAGALDTEQAGQVVPCDVLCLASRPVPASELLLQRGLRYQCHEGSWLPGGSIPGLSPAGAAAGIVDPGEQIRDGQSQAARAAAAAGYPAPATFEFSVWNSFLKSTSSPEKEEKPAAGLSVTAWDHRYRKAFVCLCEDVTVKDLHQAVAEGFDHIETLKRYSTAGMGPCQGKVCGQTASEVCARATGRDLNGIGLTTSRPPAIPVELGVLASDRRHAPVRRTSLHHWHESAGAVWMDAGAWKRPESYGRPRDEVRAVRNHVGLIDVGTLGKIEIKGPDAVELLERVYLNSWRDLKIGRARYGVMCTEEGILWDDGVCGRLGPDRYFLTATTGNAELVFGWLEMWRSAWGLDVSVENRTSALAAMNLAGPRAREVLGPLTDIDLSSKAFPYLGVRDGLVAGVPCRLLRLGFVGELGYEIHCPAPLAWSLWEALVAAGKPHHLMPFGVEAQRILRLEKGHLIFGQDTDALSTPAEAGLEGLIKFSKPLFLGRENLLRLRQMGPRSRLVGFFLDDDRFLQAPAEWLHGWEGCQVADEGRPVGRVTSFRFSPTLDRFLGLAWVPAAGSELGQRFTVRWMEKNVRARVVPTPFYDPEGKRLRS